MSHQLPQSAPPVLDISGLCKAFGPVQANQQVWLTVEQGQVHAIIGENGAGKSTLMNMLYGLVQPDRGTIKIDGKEVVIASPLTAQRLGIGMVHQHFMLVENMTGLDNILLAMPPVGSIAKGRKRLRALAEEIEEKYGFTVPLDEPVGQLPVGMQQRLELLKVLISGARILILDEPTAVLTPQEASQLFAMIDHLKDEGHSVIFISHKLDEVVRLADKATILRAGQVVECVDVEQTTPAQMATLMVGREIKNQTARQEQKAGAAMLRFDQVSLRDHRGVARLRDVSLTVHRGEILGIAGVSGNGQTELLDVAVGSRLPSAGRVVFNTDHILAENGRGVGPDQRRRLGMGFVSEDRLKEGAVSTDSASLAMLLGYQWHKNFVRRSMVQFDRLTRFCQQVMTAQAVMPKMPELAIGRFSGGNQQKLVIGRELAHDPQVIVVGEPSRGVDVGAVTRIHDQLIARRNEGHAILVVSSDLDELLTLADRIAVIHAGRIVGDMPARNADRQKIGLMMAGQVPS